MFVIIKNLNIHKIMINQKDKKYCKHFGLILTAILLMISFYLGVFTSSGIKLLIIASFTGIVSFINPGYFIVICYFWSKLGNTLGHFASIIIISFMMYLVITPLKILFRLRSDALNINFKKGHTYWIESKNKKYRFKSQF